MQYQVTINCQEIIHDDTYIMTILTRCSLIILYLTKGPTSNKKSKSIKKKRRIPYNLLEHQITV